MQRKLNIRYIGLLLTFALGAAALVSCEKDPEGGEDVWNPLKGDSPVRIRTSVAAPVTKVTGTAFDNGDRIGVFGFYHNGNASADGSWAAENGAGNNIPDYMYNQLMTYNATTSAWEYSPVKYWPNENRDGSEHKDKLSFWGYYPHGAAGLSFRAAGTETAYSNTTSGLPDLYFTQNATPASQVDLMVSDLRSDLYKNDGSDDGSGHGTLTDGEVELTFSHAMARVNLEVKKDITGEATSLSDYIVTITGISIGNLYETATYAHGSGWSGHSGTCPEVILLGSPATLVVSGSATAAGSTLAIPQSLTLSGHEVSLTINYTLQSTTDLGAGKVVEQSATIPLKDAGASAPAAWAAGTVYTYTLNFRNQGLYLKVSAAPWDDVAARSETTVLESNLYIEDPTYLRYDIDGDFNSWTDSYAAVADGVADGKLRSPRLRLITTSPAPGLKLICDNDNFRFRKYNPGTGNYDSGVTELSIVAGTEVDTYFCVVPKDGTVPSGADACKANVYLTGASGLPYLPYNAGVFPGNASSTSCQFYIVSTSAYDATYEAPYTNFKPEDR